MRALPLVVWEQVHRSEVQEVHSAVLFSVHAALELSAGSSVITL